jgi:AbrB family looped-hinge helix DNA binding protein
MQSTTITRLSTKGQVVIPSGIRKSAGLKPGAPLLVLTDGSNVMLQPVPEADMAAFARMAKASQDYARKAGLEKRDLKKMIQEVRREGRS